MANGDNTDLVLVQGELISTLSIRLAGSSTVGKCSQSLA